MWFAKRIAIGLLVSIFSLGVMACEKEGAAEKAGKEVDNAFNAVKKKAEDLNK